MIEKIIHILITDISYILDIKLADLLYNCFLVGLLISAAYCISLLIVSFPLCIYNALFKKQISSDLEEKIMSIVFKIAVAIILPTGIYAIAKE